MIHSEQFNQIITQADFEVIAPILNSTEDDAQILIWGQEEDMETALETIEERCKMAFYEVPKETRKYLKDGTTIFKRVLPGADRMYPDTDLPPIPLDTNYIENLRKKLPTEIVDRRLQLKKWKIPEDTYTYIFKKNLFPVIEKIIKKLKINPVFTGTFFGHKLKFIQGHYISSDKFNYDKIYDLFKFIKDEKLDMEISKQMMPVVYKYSKMDFESVLTTINFKKISKEKITSQIPFLKEKFLDIKFSDKNNVETKWIMGQLRKPALGNMPLNELKIIIEKQ
jgi:glutamyl-tRNA(Gln) amidotransferase subunit E